MALHYDLPVYKDAYRLILKIFEYTKDFSRGHKPRGRRPRVRQHRPGGHDNYGGASNALGFMVKRQAPARRWWRTTQHRGARQTGSPVLFEASPRVLPATRFCLLPCTNKSADMPIRNSGDCGTVWVCVEAGRAPQARSGATRSDGVLGSIPSVGSTKAQQTAAFLCRPTLARPCRSCRSANTGRHSACAAPVHPFHCGSGHRVTPLRLLKSAPARSRMSQKHQATAQKRAERVQELEKANEVDVPLWEKEAAECADEQSERNGSGQLHKAARGDHHPRCHLGTSLDDGRRTKLVPRTPWRVST